MNLTEYGTALLLLEQRRASDLDISEIYLLLKEFRRTSAAMIDEHRDITMQRAATDPRLGECLQNPPFPPESSVWKFGHIPVPSSSLSRRRDNASRGAGIPMPQHEHAMDIDEMARYFAHHGRHGGTNPFTGIAMTFSYDVHRRSVFGWILSNVTGPGGSNHNAKVAYTRIFASLAARPNRYREAIQRRQADDPSFVFEADPTYVREYLRMHLPNGPMNLTTDEVANHLMDNQVPPEWLDHAYVYGLHFLDYHYESSLHADVIRAADDERLVRLESFGVPSALPEFDGWWTPSSSDIDRIRILLHVDEKRDPPVYCFNHPAWLQVGAPAIYHQLRTRVRLGETPVRPNVPTSTAPPLPPLQDITTPVAGMSLTETSSTPSGPTATTSSQPFDAEMTGPTSPPQSGPNGSPDLGEVVPAPTTLSEDVEMTLSTATGPVEPPVALTDPPA